MTRSAIYILVIFVVSIFSVLPRLSAQEDTSTGSSKTDQAQEIQPLYNSLEGVELELTTLEIQVQNLRQQRNLALVFGFLMVAGVFGLFYYYNQNLKEKDQAIAHAMGQLNEIQQKILRLEFNKDRLEKQLVEKDLNLQLTQLSKKNEFLQTIKEEVNHMEGSVNGKESGALQKLNNLLDSDLRKEDEWQNFLATFKHVHDDYLHALKAKNAKLTPNDLRLAILMKMHLNTKEIAGILNISSQGVKKARYRLRKKLELDSAVSVQEYLISLT